MRGTAPVAAGSSPAVSAGSSTSSAPAERGEQELVGARGRALTELRPTGRAEINGEYYPVVSEGRWIERGAALKVVQVEGNRIVVEEEEE
jgi:membrane-bound serine protease (ClpP class)